jgi:glutathionylspermidine synthase
MRRLAVAERPDWERTAEAFGFNFHHMYGEKYWDETACFAFTLEEIEREIEEPSRELHALCLDLADRASGSEAMMEQLGIPPAFRDYVAQSWHRRDPTVFGRFDLGYDGSGPVKLLEYNADTPTGLYEAAFFQWIWLEQAKTHGILPADADQFNSIQERLIGAYAGLPTDSILHFTGDASNVEDNGTLTYMMDCALQAGQRVKFVDIAAIGRDVEGRFTDTDDRVIDVLANLYPWEWLFIETFGPLLPRSGTRFIEPPWKALLSTKAILPLLWELHPGHPNLLPAFFADDPRVAGLGDHVVKPVFSREGANISLHRAGEPATHTEGPYGAERRVAQAATPLFSSPEGGYAVLGSWIVGDEACGLGIREDASPITMNLSRFVPHVIADGGWTPGSGPVGT